MPSSSSTIASLPNAAEHQRQLVLGEQAATHPLHQHAAMMLSSKAEQISLAYLASNLGLCSQRIGIPALGLPRPQSLLSLKQPLPYSTAAARAFAARNVALEQLLANRPANRQLADLDYVPFRQNSHIDLTRQLLDAHTQQARSRDYALFLGQELGSAVQGLQHAPVQHSQGLEEAIQRQVIHQNLIAENARKSVLDRGDETEILSNPVTTTTSNNASSTTGRAIQESRPDGSSEKTDAPNSKKSLGGRTYRLNERWKESFQQLKEFKQTYGHCIVPRGYPRNPKLASWVAEQRKQRKIYERKRGAHSMNERIRKLDSLGFTWDAQGAAWDRNISNLKSFIAKYGHPNVPVYDKDFPKLGLWVKEQRRHFAMLQRGQKSHMTPARVEELNNLNFCWDSLGSNWEDRRQELIQFKADKGHCNVPSNYRANPRLATWVHHQRRQYRALKRGETTSLTEERIQALGEVGIQWNPSSNYVAYE